MNARGRTQFAPTEKDRECENSLSFFYTSCLQGIVCYTFQVNGRAIMSRGGSRKRDGEIVKSKILPKNNPSVTFGDEPFFMFIYNLSIFLTSTAFVDTNAEPRARRGEKSQHDLSKFFWIMNLIPHQRCRQFYIGNAVCFRE